MSTRAMRLKTQARVLACLQVVFLRFQMSKNNPFLKAWLGLKRIVPIISESTETRVRGALKAVRAVQGCVSVSSVVKTTLQNLSAPWAMGDGIPIDTHTPLGV